MVEDPGQGRCVGIGQDVRPVDEGLKPVDGHQASVDLAEPNRLHLCEGPVLLDRLPVGAAARGIGFRAERWLRAVADPTRGPGRRERGHGHRNGQGDAGERAGEAGEVPVH